MATSDPKLTRLPPLSRSQIRHTTVKVAQVLPHQDWINMAPGETLTMTTRDMPGVQVTLPAEDWETLTEIVIAHYEARSQNPAVNDAWLQYRMLLAMTRS